MRYKDGALNELQDLWGFGSNHIANYTPEERYNKLMEWNMEEWMKGDSNGMEIRRENYKSDEEFYEASVQAFKDNLDLIAEQTKDSYDSMIEAENAVLDLSDKSNQLLKDLRDNQLELENKVLNAIEQRSQREIDALSKERQALQESTDNYINGLQDSLNKEKEMYERNQRGEELNRKQRQLDILRRSGGSGSQIGRAHV